MPGSSSAVAPLPCLCTELRRAARAVTRLYDAAQRETGLSSGQLPLLFALEAGPRRQGDLEELYFLDTTTLTRSLRTLARGGYIETHPGEADRRERWHSLTGKGRETLIEARGHWERVQGELAAEIAKEVDWPRLQRDLHAIVRAAGK